MRSVQQAVCLVQQFGKAIKPGDRVYLWECGPRGGIIGLAEVAEAPRIQPEPAEQLPFIREPEKFAGDQLRRRRPHPLGRRRSSGYESRSVF